MATDFYKLGAARAVQTFIGQLDAEDDNPTAPPMKYASKTAVVRMVEKLSAQEKRKKAAPTVTRRAANKSTRFKAMVSKLKKKKKKKGARS